MPEATYTVEMLLKWIGDNRALVAGSTQARGLQKNVMALRAEIKMLGAQALTQFNLICGGLTRMGKKAMLAGGLMLGAFGGFFAMASKWGAKFEGYRVTLQQLYGDAAKAEGAFKWIREFQIKTPYTPEELMEGLKTMKVFGLDAEKWLPAVGDMASTIGTDLETMSRAVSKAFASGQQGAMQLQRSYGMSMAKLVEISGHSEAELKNDLNKYRKALYKFITDPKFKGGMARYAKTFKGVLSSIKGGFQDFMGAVGTSINKVMRADFQKIVDWIIKVSASGKLDEWAERVAKGFKMIYEGLKKAGAILWKFIKPFVEFFKNHPQMLKWAIAGIAVSGALLLVGGGIMFVVGKLGQMGVGLVHGIGTLKKFGGTLMALFTKTKAAGGLSSLMGGLTAKGGIMGKIGGLFAGGGAAAGGGIAATLATALPIIGAVIAGLALLATAWKKNFAGIREAAAKALKPLLDIVRAIFGIGKKANILKTVGAVLKAVWLGFAKAVAPVFKLIITIIGAAFRILKAVLMPIIKVLGKVFQALGLAGKGAGEGIAGAFEGLAKVVGFVADAIGWVIDVIATGFEWTIGLIIKGIKAIWEGTSTLGKVLRVIFWPITLLILQIKAMIFVIKQVIGWFRKTGDEGVSNWQKIGNAVRFVCGFIKLAVEKTIGKAIEIFTKLWGNIKTGAAAAWNWIKANLIDPLVAAFNWLRDKVFKPIGDFFAHLFDPLINAFQTAIDWIKTTVGKLFSGKGIGAIAKFFGMSEEELEALKTWSKAAGAKSPAGAGARAGKAGADGGGLAPIQPGGAAAGAGAGGAAGGGAGGGGGPQIQNIYYHFHFTQDAIKMIIAKLDNPQEFLKLLGTSLSYETAVP